MKSEYIVDLFDKSFVGKVLSFGVAIGNVTIEKGKIIKSDEILFIKRLELSHVLNLNSDVKGYIIAEGGVTDHYTMIIASRALPVFKIADWEDKVKSVPDGSYLCVLNCDESWVGFINNKNEERHLAQDYVTKYQLNNTRKIAKEIKEELAGRFYINADSSSDIKELELVNYDGVGLIRLENVILNSGLLKNFVDLFLHDLKLETNNSGLHHFHDQLKIAIEEILEKVKGQQVNIRLPDFDGIDIVKFIKLERPDVSLEEEKNISNYRGIKLLLRAPKLMSQILKCLCEISFEIKLNSDIKLNVLVPYVMLTGEFLYVKKRLSDINEMLGFDSIPELGVMIETMQAVLRIKELCEHTALFMIGTNDLSSSYYGIDRSAHSVNEWYKYKGILKADFKVFMTKEFIDWINECVIKIRNLKGERVFIGCCGAHLGLEANLNKLIALDLDCYSFQKSFI